MKDMEEITKLKEELEQTKVNFQKQKQEELEQQKREFQKITTQTEEQRIIVTRNVEGKERQLLLEIERLNKLLKEMQDRDEKMRKGLLTHERQGFLVKKGNTGGKMQKRWFVLRGEYLLYFKGKEAQSLAHPSGCIYLVTAIVVEIEEKESIKQSGGDKAMKNGFEIRCPSENGRIYFLVADDDITRKEWMESMKSAKGAYFIRVKEGGTNSISNPSSGGNSGGISPRASTKSLTLSSSQNSAINTGPQSTPSNTNTNTTSSSPSSTTTTTATTNSK